MAEIFQQYITKNGIIVPDTADVKEQVESEFKAALGENLSLEESTPQGRLIEAETIARKSVLENNAYMANQLNPNTSSGIFLDANCALVGISRKSATHTEVLATVTGVGGTVIAAGSQAKTSAGDLFEIVNDYTIPTSGTGTTYFQSVNEGPVPCATNTLTQIVTAVFGWETINNPVAAVIGVNTESDSDLRLRRSKSIYKGSSLLRSIESSVLKVDGVLSVFPAENETNGTKIIDGKQLVPHSIWIVVDGGADQDVAQAIWEHKSLGCAYNGEEEVTVYGPYNVAYTVKFDRPTYQPFTIDVTVTSPLTIDAQEVESEVKAALADWANGKIPGVDGLGLGVDVSPFEAASAITARIPGLFVNNVEVAFSRDEPGTSLLELKVYEKATLAAEDITVTVNTISQ